MKNQILLSFLLISLVSCQRTAKTETQEATENTTSGAAIVFKESNFDFGEIMEGDTVEHDFEFTNTGNSPLEIIDVKVQCGCTVASRPEKPIGAGQTDKITVRFNSTGKPGINNKYVTVITNAKIQPKPIAFKATVNQAVE